MTAIIENRVRLVVIVVDEAGDFVIAGVTVIVAAFLVICGIVVVHPLPAIVTGNIMVITTGSTYVVIADVVQVVSAKAVAAAGAEGCFLIEAGFAVVVVLEGEDVVCGEG